MNRLISSSTRGLPRSWNRVRCHDPPRGTPRCMPRQVHGFSTTGLPQGDCSLSTIRTTILKSALSQVHQLGWTDDALTAATATVCENSPTDVSMSVVGMVSRDDLIAFCMDQWNVQLRRDLAKIDDVEEEDPLERGIQTRLQYLIPYLRSGRWHEGMALGLRGPANALQTQRQLREMVGILVASSPDHRTLGTVERVALGAVYVATELHLLTDTSPGYTDTWTFLSHRMGDWRRFISMTEGTSQAQDALFVASSVATSLAGGILSVLVPQIATTSLFQNLLTAWGGATDRKTGTHPDDYRVDKPSPISDAKK